MPFSLITEKYFNFNPLYFFYNVAAMLAYNIAGVRTEIECFMKRLITTPFSSQSTSICFSGLRVVIECAITHQD